MKKLTAEKILAGAPVQPGTTQSIEEYKASVKEYNAAQRTYKEGIITTLESMGEREIVELVEEFRRLPQTSGADKVRVTSWTGSIRSKFAALFPGREIQPVKTGTTIVGYKIVDITNDTTVKRVAEIMSLIETYPALFAITDEEDIKSVIEQTDRNAEAIARHKVQKAGLVRELETLQSEITRATHTASQVIALTGKANKEIDRAVAAMVTKADKLAAAIDAPFDMAVSG